MKRTATLFLLTAFLWCGWTTDAQTVRNGLDVIWARDVDSAAMTFDGVLDEPAWDAAECVTVGIGTFFTPGGGWQLYREDIPPTDPVDADVCFLRNGNEVWVGVNARDKSIGGTPGFFQHDGIVMSINDHTNRTEFGYVDGAWTGDNWFPASNTDEFFYTWINRPDFGIVDSVGINPTFLGNEASMNMPVLEKWDARTVVNGVSNDDFNGNADPTDDVGYTMEIKFQMDNFGYDMTAGLDRIGLTFGIYDLDYAWPADAGGPAFRTRAWWQSPWGGDQPWGSAFVYGSPSVTINSGAAPEIAEPEIRMPGLIGGNVVVDGALDEGIWDAISPVLRLKYKATPEELDQLPGYGPYYTGWFRPGGGDKAPPVIDPSTGTFKVFYQGTKVYVGMESDDAAIGGQSDEGRADGFRFTVRNLFPDPETYTEGSRFDGLQFMVVVDSMGNANLLQDAFDDPKVDGDPGEAITAAVTLRDGSTAGNSNDVDTGYRIEMEIDLDLLGYDLDATERTIWWSAVYFDGDDLPVAEDSYGVRTWFLGERGGNMQGARTYLDPMLVVANEDGTAALPERIELRGAFPNPFSSEARVAYALPQSGDVTVRVYDVLGREVAELAAGQQAAGANSVLFDGSGLSAGLYLYRVDLDGAAAQSSVTGRMVLVK